MPVAIKFLKGAEGKRRAVGVVHGIDSNWSEGQIQKFLGGKEPWKP